MTEDQTTTDTAAEIQIETREWVMRGEHIIDDPLEYTHDLFVRHDDLPEIIAAYLNANKIPERLAAKDAEIERLRDELVETSCAAEYYGAQAKRRREELAGLKARAVGSHTILSRSVGPGPVSAECSCRVEIEAASGRELDTLVREHLAPASAVDGGGEKTLAELRAALAAPARLAPTEESGETRGWNKGDDVTVDGSHQVGTVVGPSGKTSGRVLVAWPDRERWERAEDLRPAPSPQGNSEASDGK